ncbi:MAG: glycoside hydrolase [Planctomycetes bacterium GWF2_42_9]|nr:MAG: glycoside hydrolase [Planctomycetes bacterium GWF2_42_9]
MTKQATRYLEVDPWVIEEKDFYPKYSMVSESIFSLANEFMGVRGYFDEGYTGQTMVGSYFNGIFERFYIEHPFAHRGMASQEQKMLNSVDWLYTRLILDDETLDIANCKFTDFTRKLDLRTGVLTREFIWHNKKGKKLRLKFERFLSMDYHQLGFQRITFEPLNFSGIIKVESGLDFNLIHHNTSGFKSKPFESLWVCRKKGRQNNITAILSQIPVSQHTVFCAFKLDLPDKTKCKQNQDEKFISQSFEIKLQQGQKTHFDKTAVGVTEKNPNVPYRTLWNIGIEKTSKLREIDFDNALEKQKKYWSDVWEKLDIKIEGDSLNQQGIRFCIFNLHQTYHGVDSSLNVPAKGLSGDGYDGKTWWDTETYCLPFYMFNNPKAAKNLLDYRYKTLPQACERSKEVDGCKGARYPMSTIDGIETCYVWQHGDLEIHVSAAVVYGIWHYDKIIGDKEFLYTKGIEMLLEICRYHASRGSFSQKTGEFGFWNVMGPDEFHMQVNNNAYTNCMAKKMFEYTLDVVKEMHVKSPQQLRKVAKKINLNESELKGWINKARKMRTNFDKKTEMFEQHDGFFDLPHIDCRSISPEEYPIYSHWPYLKIFRYDMCKQPDALLLLFFFGNDYSKQCKKTNYEYYESRCSHESSLSPAIHSILAAELGKHKEAYKFFAHATRLDLDDYNRNAWAGLHITSMAGAWMNIVQGFGGMRTDGNTLSFAPSIPAKWKAFSFKILYNDTVLEVRIDRKYAYFITSNENTIQIQVFNKKYKVNKSGISVKLPAGRIAKA